MKKHCFFSEKAVFFITLSAGKEYLTEIITFQKNKLYHRESKTVCTENRNSYTKIIQNETGYTKTQTR